MIGTNTSPNDQLHPLVRVLFRLRSFCKEPGNVQVILLERFETRLRRMVRQVTGP
jgi:hypothetical protein